MALCNVFFSHAILTLHQRKLSGYKPVVYTINQMKYHSVGTAKYFQCQIYVLLIRDKNTIALGLSMFSVSQDYGRRLRNKYLPRLPLKVNNDCFDPV